MTNVGIINVSTVTIRIMCRDVNVNAGRERPLWRSSNEHSRNATEGVPYQKKRVLIFFVIVATEGVSYPMLGMQYFTVNFATNGDPYQMVGAWCFAVYECHGGHSLRT